MVRMQQPMNSGVAGGGGADQPVHQSGGGSKNGSEKWASGFWGGNIAVCPGAELSITHATANEPEFMRCLE